jgi:hypothetical protein
MLSSTPADTQRHSRSQGAVDPPSTVRNYGDEWHHLVWSLGHICRGAGSRGAFAVLWAAPVSRNSRMPVLGSMGGSARRVSIAGSA